MADSSKERQARAEAAYSEIGEAVSLTQLIKAVKSAQAGKGQKMGKRELKAKAALQKAEAAAAAQAKAEADLAAAMAQEAETARLEAEATAKAALAAETRARREASVLAERQRREAQATKVKTLKKTVDQLIGQALKSPTAQQINDIIRLQASLKTAWAALPASMQYAEDRAKLIENDEIISDLQEIYKQQQQVEQVHDDQVDDAKTEQANALVAALKRYGKLGRSNLGAVSNTASGILKAGAITLGLYAYDKGTAYGQLAKRGAKGLVRGVQSGYNMMAAPVRAVVSGLKSVSTKLGEIKDKTAAWFEKKFGPMFRKIWRIVSMPAALAKGAGSFLSKAMTWGAMISSLLIPIVKGLYKTLSETFTLDYVSEKFNEFKDWAFNKIKDFFTWLMPSTAEATKPMVDAARSGVASAQRIGQAAGDKMGLPMVNPDNKTENPDLKQLQDVYGYYKSSGNFMSRGLYAFQVRRQLGFMDPNVIDDKLAANLTADGFKVPRKNPLWANRYDSPTVKSSVSASVGSPTSAGGGGGSSVTATPKPQTFAEGSGHTSLGSSPTSPGLGVVSIPRSLVGDSFAVMNGGVLGY